jgi:hypothetical protein
MAYEGQVHRLFTDSKCDDLYEYPLTFPTFQIFDVLQYISAFLKCVKRLNYGSNCRNYDLRWLLLPGTRCPHPKLYNIRDRDISQVKVGAGIISAFLKYRFVVQGSGSY